MELTLLLIPLHMELQVKTCVMRYRIVGYSSSVIKQKLQQMRRYLELTENHVEPLNNSNAS